MARKQSPDRLSQARVEVARASEGLLDAYLV